jgi:hypothetical protein
VDYRNAPHRLRAARHRRLHAGHRHETLALDAQHVKRHGCRRREALSQIAPGRDVPAGRRAVLAAGRAAVHPRRRRTGNQRRGKSRAGRKGWPARWRSSPTFATCKRPAPPAKSAALRRNRSRLQPASRVGRNELPRLLLRRGIGERWKALIPGIDGSARAYSDVAEIREHPLKAVRA